MVSLSEPLGSRDLDAVRKRRQEEAGGDRLTVDEHRACPADTDPARLADGQDVELTPEHGEEGLPRSGLDLDRIAVQPKRNLHDNPATHSTHLAHHTRVFRR